MDYNGIHGGGYEIGDADAIREVVLNFAISCNSDHIFKVENPLVLIKWSHQSTNIYFFVLRKKDQSFLYFEVIL